MFPANLVLESGFEADLADGEHEFGRRHAAGSYRSCAPGRDGRETLGQRVAAGGGSMLRIAAIFQPLGSRRSTIDVSMCWSVPSARPRLS